MTRALGYGAAGAYASSICHYCGKFATTSDHIVPRAAFLMHQSALPSWFRENNIAPSCLLCNNFKHDYRSDCECDQCRWVWVTALGYGEEWIKPYYLEQFREGSRMRRVIKVGMARL